MWKMVRSPTLFLLHEGFSPARACAFPPMMGRIYTLRLETPVQDSPCFWTTRAASASGFALFLCTPRAAAIVPSTAHSAPYPCHRHTQRRRLPCARHTAASFARSLTHGSPGRRHGWFLPLLPCCGHWSGAARQSWRPPVKNPQR